jgi:hypothetical protein
MFYQKMTGVNPAPTGVLEFFAYKILDFGSRINVGMLPEKSRQG